jgi:hypothetical protein
MDIERSVQCLGKEDARMTMTPASGLAGLHATTDHGATLRLSRLLRRPVADRSEESSVAACRSWASRLPSRSAERSR